jgi:microsomal dipeptidase-like Zn-dependent dipeptidase
LIPNFENEDDLINITEHLLKRQFRENEITKILGGNFLRVLRQVLKSRDEVDLSLGLPT